jgi:hypothetical protein
MLILVEGLDYPNYQYFFVKTDGKWIGNLNWTLMNILF